MEGCDSSDTSKPPQCQDQAIKAGVCGKTIEARCKGSKCKDKNWHTFRIVDVCPADRTYHNHKGGDATVAPDDYACASSDKIVLDVDESFHKDKWDSGNVSIEVKLPK